MAFFGMLRHIFGSIWAHFRTYATSRPGALARSILEALEESRRTTDETLSRIEKEFRPEAAVARYLELYHEAVGDPRA